MSGIVEIQPIKMQRWGGFDLEDDSDASVGS